MATLVLRGGRVIDPGNERDEVTDLLIRDGRVAGVGPGLSADRALDVTGLIVGPGFIDLHSHVHSVAGQRLQAFDGVTTTLDLEAGVMPVARAYDKAAREGRPLNYGFSASWAGARGRVLSGVTDDVDFGALRALLADPRWQRSSSSGQLATWLQMLRDELENGALGIGILMGYAPRTDPAEMVAVGRLAAEAGVATFTHVRDLVEADPTTPIDGSLEIARVAAETGAHMHHCHVNSTSRRHIDRVLQTLDESRRQGSKVTVEAYPYGSGSTAVGAVFLAPERLGAFGLTPSSLIIVRTGERIRDADRLREVRRTTPDAQVIVEFFDETLPADAFLLQQSLHYPDAIIASDAIPVFFADGTCESLQWPLPAGNTHPRTSGTYGRAIRTMVRESGAWTWSEAFRRCSWLPAQVLGFVPDAGRKGHLGVGADADIVVLDPADISDAATYEAPTRPSVGVRHLFVAGTPVIRDSDLLVDAFPGKPLRSRPR